MNHYHVHHNSTTTANSSSDPTCPLGNSFPQCSIIDSTIQPWHIQAPWIVLLASLAILSMPTILLRSKSKHKAMQTLAWMFLECLMLLFLSTTMDHLSISYTLSSHACVYLLLNMHIHPALLGGPIWWSLRYLAVTVFLLFQYTLGPAVSIVRWPGGPDDTPCAYLAHLIGNIVPPIVIWIISSISQIAYFVTLIDDP